MVYENHLLADNVNIARTGSIDTERGTMITALSPDKLEKRSRKGAKLIVPKNLVIQ